MRLVVRLATGLALLLLPACGHDSAPPPSSWRHALVRWDNALLPVEDREGVPLPGCYPRIDDGWLALDPLRGRFLLARLEHLPCSPGAVLPTVTTGTFDAAGDSLRFRRTRTYDYLPGAGAACQCAFPHMGELAMDLGAAGWKPVAFALARTAGGAPPAGALALRAMAGRSLPYTASYATCSTVFRGGTLTLTPLAPDSATGSFRLQRQAETTCASAPPAVSEGSYEAIGGALWLDGRPGLVSRGRIVVYDQGTTLEFGR